MDMLTDMLAIHYTEALSETYRLAETETEAETSPNGRMILTEVPMGG